jgi:hypothetical protein
MGDKHLFVPRDIKENLPFPWLLPKRKKEKKDSQEQQASPFPRGVAQIYTVHVVQ